MSVVEQRAHPLTPQADQSPSGVTYSEIRDWAVYLDYFTAEDLAASMGVNIEIGVRGVRALLYHGICEDTGETLEIDGRELAIVHYVPLPPGPKEHWTGPPEWRTCDQDLVPPNRGLPVRLVKENRRLQSLPGERHRMMLREKRYEAMEQARAAAQAKQARKRNEAAKDAVQRRRHAAAAKRRAKAEAKRTEHPLVT